MMPFTQMMENVDPATRFDRPEDCGVDDDDVVWKEIAPVRFMLVSTSHGFIYYQLVPFIKIGSSRKQVAGPRPGKDLYRRLRRTGAGFASVCSD